MSLLTPDLGLLFWMLVSFGLVLGILAKFGFPVITRMVDKRSDYIQKSLDEAEKADRRIAGIEQEARKIMDDAQKRQAEMLAAAVADSERIMQAAREKADREAARKLEEAKGQIELQKQKAIGELRSTIAMLSVDVAEKVLRGSLDDRSASEQYVGRLVDEAERNAAKKPQN